MFGCNRVTGMTTPVKLSMVLSEVQPNPYLQSHEHFLDIDFAGSLPPIIMAHKALTK